MFNREEREGPVQLKQYKYYTARYEEQRKREQIGSGTDKSPGLPFNATTHGSSSSVLTMYSSQIFMSTYGLLDRPRVTLVKFQAS